MPRAIEQIRKVRKAWDEGDYDALLELLGKSSDVAAFEDEDASFDPESLERGVSPVSYTHLDVYKRQANSRISRVESTGCTSNASSNSFEFPLWRSDGRRARRSDSRRIQRCIRTEFGRCAGRK